MGKNKYYCKIDGKVYNFQKFLELVKENREWDAVEFVVKETGYDYGVSGDIVMYIRALDFEIPAFIETSKLPAELKRLKALQPPQCPRCSSTAITAGPVGYYGLAAISNRTRNRCAKCGYSWLPGF